LIQESDQGNYLQRKSIFRAISKNILGAGEIDTLMLQTTREQSGVGYDSSDSEDLRK